jgi:hypothetical protein
MRVRPAYYREQARRSRHLAKKAADAKIKGHLLNVAEQYDKLATEAEERGQSVSPAA